MQLTFSYHECEVKKRSMQRLTANNSHFDWLFTVLVNNRKITRIHLNGFKFWLVKIYKEKSVKTVKNEKHDL